MPKPLSWLAGFLPWLALLAAALPAHASLPPELAAALRLLQEQDSYSWEFINGDPGIVEQNIQTHRGSVTALQQSFSPHVLGRLASTGDILLRRDWPDGVEMDTLATANGQIITRTPEGWMTTREILDALADEQVHSDTPTDRYSWLKRADRPNVRRPDQELAALLRQSGDCKASGDGFIAHVVISVPGWEKSSDENVPTATFTITVHMSDGMIRTYEIKTDFTRLTARARVQVPTSDDKLVVLSYLPVTKLDVPEEAWSKLKSTR